MICIFSLSVMFVTYFNPFAPERPVTAHADPRPFYPFAFGACRTSQADILHLDQKAEKCTTCKPVCGKF